MMDHWTTVLVPLSGPPGHHMQSVTWMHFGQGPVQKPTKTPWSRIAEKLQCFKTQKEATNLAELRALCKRMESYLKAGM